MAVLSPADYPQVRAALDLSLTAAQLSDATIGLDIFLGATEQWVVDTIPAATLAALSAADTNRLHRAAVWHLAGILAPRLPAVVRRGDRDITEQLEPVDRDAQGATLLGMAEQEIRSILAGLDVPDTSTGVMPTQFILSTGTRGR